MRVDTATKPSIVALPEEEVEEDAARKIWRPPDTFQRSQTKYLVPLSGMMRLKVIICKHLPVLVLNRSQPENGRLPSDFLEARDFSWIASVYLDNEARETFHTRLGREEGAQLFRVRWYNSFREPPERVFVERKSDATFWPHAHCTSLNHKSGASC